MASLQQSIAEKFLVALAQNKDIDADKIEKMRQLLARGTKPKADEFVRVFTTPVGGEVK
jgi:hypothetical protein